VPTILDLTGLDHLLAGLRRIQHLDATPLMMSWQLIIEADNRQGVMAGIDKDGVPMAPVTYRPKGPPKRHLRRKVGAYNPGVGGNLSSSEYRRLGGPPLAPRGTGSRVITNLLTGYEGPPTGAPMWAAIGYWEGVVSPKGNPFLRYHFTGAGRLPRRDLRGLRPAGRAKALTALTAWGRGEIRDAFG
jgi:hypothetical protein